MGVISIVNGDYKPTNITGGHHLVAAEAGLGSPETQDPTLARAEAWKMSKSEGSPMKFAAVSIQSSMFGGVFPHMFP